MIRHKKILVAVSILVVAALAVGFFFINFDQYNKNLAAELAKPMEQALVDRGGVKACQDGDSGRGPDNRRPWYQVFYQMPMDKNAAQSLANEIASRQGYSLKHATLKDRGPVSVADQFVDAWYFDNTSKNIPYGDIQPGPVELAFIVDDSNSTYNCGKRTSQNSVIGISIKLRDFK